MTYLYSNIDWGRVKSVGFDMDGTLYDEFDFIVQPYREISLYLGTNAYEFMCQRWVQKGSSYNKIFDESYEQYRGQLELSKEEFIKKALSIFRNYNPQLALSNRVRTLLDFFSKNFQLFLVSDGQLELQKRKFESLDLGAYFPEESVVFTGKDPKYLEKPKTGSIEILNLDPENAIYFGDREKDKEFAMNTGMQFQKVYHLIHVEK